MPVLPKAVCGWSLRVYPASGTAFCSRSSLSTGHMGSMFMRKSGWMGFVWSLGRRIGPTQPDGRFGGSGRSGIMVLSRALIRAASDIFPNSERLCSNN